MSKGLEALESLRERVNTNDYGFGFADYDPQAGAECDVIEKELKALEIIRKKFVNLTVFRMTSFMKKEGVDCYNVHFSSEEMHLTSEEFDLLKEVLK